MINDQTIKTEGKTGEWTNIEDGLPAPLERVIATHDGEFTGEYFINLAGEWRRGDREAARHTSKPITRWMPMPSPELHPSGKST